jgi:hypothetical protein
MDTFNRALGNYLAAVREAESKIQDTKRSSDSKGDNAADPATTAATTLGGRAS